MIQYVKNIYYAEQGKNWQNKNYCFSKQLLIIKISVQEPFTYLFSIKIFTYTDIHRLNTSDFTFKNERIHKNVLSEK